jgi:hypothetical protein
MSEGTNDPIRHRILEILYGKATQGTDWRVTREELRRLLLIEDKLIDFNVFCLNEVKLAQIREIQGHNWSTVIITAKSIDVIENKQNFSDEYPFIKTTIMQIQGDVNAPIIQATDSQVNFSQQVNDAFKQAYRIVENKIDVQSEQKEDIKKNLKVLEEELQNKEADLGKVQKAWTWIERNANWLVPTLTQVISDGIQIVLHSA